MTVEAGLKAELGVGMHDMSEVMFLEEHSSSPVRVAGLVSRATRGSAASMEAGLGLAALVRTPTKLALVVVGLARRVGPALMWWWWL
jgi:hypothetical protein